MEVTVYIHLGEDGIYSLFDEENSPLNYGLIGEGATPEEAIKEWYAVYEDMKKSYAENNIPFVEATFRINVKRRLLKSRQS